MITLTKDQNDAIYKLKNWWKNKDRQIFEIAGYSGVGKSKLASIFIKDIGLEEINVRYATYTGKAALVLQTRGVPATTIHKLIYNIVIKKELLLDKDGEPKLDKNGNKKYYKKISFVKKDKLERDIKLLVLDECSMINKQMWDDLRSFDLPIIVLGDPGQLPPIYGKPLLLQQPDVLMTTIVRQAEDSNIIQISKDIREKKYIPVPYNRRYNDGKDVWIIYEDELTDKILTSVDIIICHTNAKRKEINDYIRYDILGRKSRLPEKGDKIICRKNNWEEILEGEGIPLVNGMIGYVKNNINLENMTSVTADIDFQPDFTSDFFHNIELNRKIFEIQDKGELLNEMKYGNGNKFEFGYAITCHLSQGSEWDKVLVFEDYMYDADYKAKWLYTAVTRAKKKLIIVRKR